MCKVKNLILNRLYNRKNLFFRSIRTFSVPKEISYTGPKDTYINSGFELKNEDTEKLINIVKESLKLKLLSCTYFSEDIGKQYLELAILEHKNLLLDDAKNHYLKSYEIFKKVQGELSITCATIQTYLGVLFKDIGDLTKSEEFLQLSLSNKKILLKNEKNNFLLVDTLNNMGSLYQLKKDYVSSIEYFEQCIRILLASSVELNKNEQISLCYYNLSFSYIGLNDFVSAITCLIRSYRIAEVTFGPDHNLTNRIKIVYERLQEEMKNPIPDIHTK